MIKRILASTCVVLAGFSQATHACDRLPPENASKNATRVVNLSAAWPDSMILQNLRLQIGRADVKRAQSKDSTVTEYSYFDKIVIITRSVKDGVQVKLVEKNQDTLMWKLGSCDRAVPDRAG